MEHEEDSSSHPSRKRDRSSIEDCNDYAALQEQDGRGAPLKRRPRNAAVVGSYVIKTFPGEAPTSGPRFLLGKVMSYGCGLYTTVFDDGSREALHNQELRQMLLGQQELSQGDPDEVFQTKKIKLEELISSEGSNAATVAAPARTRSRKSSSAVTMPENTSITMTENANMAKNLDSVDVSPPNIDVSILEEDDEDDADSCTDSSCDSLPILASNMVLETLPSIPKLPLPPSSSDICVPEDAIPLLFSVYSFLRSFSHQLFLSPFGFDDFVGSLNCTFRNTLFDAVHVALMRALRRHFEAVASEGSKIASRSLKLVSWNLLDILSWPVILIQHFFIMGHMKQIQLKSFLAGTLVDEYHRLSVTCKLRVLQILCDDVVEALDLRTELAMRESMDEERDDDFYPNTLYPENGPRRVHPRYSKTSACKDIESLEHAVTAEQVNGIKVIGKDAGGLDVGQDGNSDECRLCGMDGTLICCDGCPSAYHSRCISLNKASLPEGQWFCPECIIKRIGPTSSRISLGIKGAEHFGVDPFGRIFLGVCNYLLVLEDCSPTPISRYYNQNDVVKVFQLLCSAQGASPHYDNICQAIASFWEIPMAEYLQLDRPQPPATSLGDKNLTISENSNLSVIPYSRGENDPVGPVEFNGENIRFSKNNESSFVTHLKDRHLHQQEKKMQSFHTGVKYITNLNGLKNELLAVEDLNMSVLDSPQLVTEPSLSSVTPALPTDNYSTNHPDPIQMIGFSHNELFSSKIIDESSREDASSINSQTKTHSLCSHNEYLLDNRSNNGNIIGKSNIFSYSGASFKPQVYTNQYIHGEVAASAAAKLAALSEEAKVSQSHTSYNHRKNISLDLALQVKAFSGVCLHFQWPSSEKKTTDIPRERCGWCIACKGAATCKKGCLLNAAVSNAVKVSSKCLRTIKNDGRIISAIAAYILHVEENLHDLMDGLLADAKYNFQWRKSVKDASTCTVLKYLLLELEENIREVAFSAGWMKPVDEWAVELPGVVKGECFSGSSQRRVFGGRRNRKQPAISDINTSDGEDGLEQFKWWRGGKCLRDIFHFGELPRSLAKRTARQGGFRVVSGIFYSSYHKIPVRTRQLSWRVAVEASKNTSVLAFQVRYLDAYLRWKELVRPEQTLPDGKTSDIEASAFRNANIYDRKVLDDKISYAVKFVNQKHLPLRVKKNILEVEHDLDEREKLWFSECYVPLYLIKEYEGRKDQASLSTAVSEVKSSSLPKFHRQRKTICKDIFSYLFNKKHAKHPCVSCKQDVLFRDSDRCKNCQGHCHKHCLAKGSMCSPCYSESDLLTETRVGSLPVSQDLVQLGAKTKTNNVANPFKLVSSEEVLLEEKTTTSSSMTEKKKKNVTYGLIWKRKRPNESGMDFRHNHLIQRGGGAPEASLEPICKLCSKSYNRELMYIRCETCLNWYHAESVHLEEEQLPDLVGFKCCKCRRVKIPRCPYEDSDSKKAELRPGQKNHVRQCSLSPQLVLTPPVNDHIKDEDIVFPVERIDDGNLIADEDHLQQNAPKLACVPFSQKKLPVRRLANHGMQMDGPSAADNVDSGCSALAEKGFSTIHEADCAKSIERSSLMESEMDFRSADDSRETSATDIKEDFLGSDGVGPDDMEYEPQTYFSFTELLSAGDGDMGNLYDDDDWCQLSAYGVDEDDNAAQDGGFCLSESCDMGLAEEFVSVSEVTTLEGAECRRCKQSKPPPDLMCGMCGFIIHYLCSPWEEREVHEKGKWRCGYCRDWR